MSKRHQMLEIAAKRGAKRVRLFGSAARGDSGPSSDVDFLVEFEPGRSLFGHGGLVMDLQELLGCKVDVVSEQALDPDTANESCGRRCRYEKGSGSAP
jgi:predicted nucleotidyltransferase